MPETGQPRRNGQVSRNIQSAKIQSRKTYNLNRLITRSEIDSIIIIKGSMQKQKSRTRQFHWVILPNIQRTYTNSFQAIPKYIRGGNTPKFTL